MIRRNGPRRTCQRLIIWPAAIVLLPLALLPGGCSGSFVGDPSDSPGRSEGQSSDPVETTAAQDAPEEQTSLGGKVTLAGFAPDAVSAESFEKALHAAVFIEVKYRPIEEETPDEDDLISGSGSGFVIAEEGLILTNAHVVESVKEFDVSTEVLATEATRPKNRLVYILHSVTVRTHSGTRQARVYPASVLCTRPFPVDLALLRIRPEETLSALDFVSEEDFDKLKVTDPVWAVGFPLGVRMEMSLAADVKLTRNPNGPDISVRDGTVTSIRHGDDGKVKALEHNCNIERGNSGGPLIDKSGRVVGINYCQLGQRTPFAIPAPTALDQFKHTLSARKGRKGRTLRVDPDDSAAYKTLIAALEEAKPGDTVDIAAGEFDVERRWREFASLRGVWLRGAGMGKTTLLGYVFVRRPSDFGETYADFGETYMEVSDLTVKGGTRPSALACSGGSETYVHDVEVIGGSEVAAVYIFGGSTNVVSCRFTSREGSAIDISSGDGGKPTPRLERVHISAPELGHAGHNSVAQVGEDGAPVFEGCTFRAFGGTGSRSTALLWVLGGGAPSVRGCVFRPEKWANFAVRIKEASGTFRANYFRIKGREFSNSCSCGMMLHDAKGVHIERNRFHVTCQRGQGYLRMEGSRSVSVWGSDPGLAICLIGPKDQVTIADNLFDGGNVRIVTGPEVIFWLSSGSIRADGELESTVFPERGNVYVDTRPTPRGYDYQESDPPR